MSDVAPKGGLSLLLDAQRKMLAKLQRGTLVKFDETPTSGGVMWLVLGSTLHARAKVVIIRGRTHRLVEIADRMIVDLSDSNTRHILRSNPHTCVNLKERNEE